MSRPLDIFAMAVEFEGSARAVCLDRACGDDAALRAEVESLLQAHDAAGAFLGDPTHEIGSSAPPSDATTHSRRHAAPSETPGQRIGRYKLLQPIGEGGFGSVWMAEQREPVKRRVALKIIKLGMDTKQVIARFEAERQALAMMDHPNIAKVLDAGATDGGRPYFVMELINGVPILEYCDTNRLDTTLRLNLFIKVCNAIQHAHQKGIIHRDLKPNNVMITLHDGVPVPKVIDFGIAKATNQELTEKTLFTQHQQMIGTPAYMSPEQAEMSGLDIDTRSDIYSLGVLLYELLTGTTPFDSSELMSKGFAEMVRIIREAEPDRPSTRLNTMGDRATRTAQQRCVDVRELGSVLRGDLDWIVMRCLEKDRSRRYDTANGLAMDIQRHLDDEPVSAGPPSTGYRVRKFVKRNRAGVIAATLLAAVLLLGIAGTTGGMVWALTQKARAELAERDKQRELTRATEVKRLITEMLASIDPSIARGQDTKLLAGILEDTARRLSHGEIRDELIEAELHHVIGIAFAGIGHWETAESHIPVAVQMRSRLLGKEDPATLESVAALISLRGMQGKIAGLDELARENWERRERVLGPEHRDTLESMATYADSCGMMGRFGEAEAIGTQVTSIRLRVLGLDDSDTIDSLRQSAVIHYLNGRTDEARRLFEQVLGSRLRTVGTSHPKTLMAMHHLADFYELMHEYDAALPLRVRLVELAPDLIGALHPHTLSSRSALGELLLLLGRHEEALGVYEILVDDRRDLDKDLSKALTWFAIKRLGTCFEHLGRYDEALSLYRELLAGLPSSADGTGVPPIALSTAAWLHTRELEELSDPSRALELAQRAIDVVHDIRTKNAEARFPRYHEMLDTLALAQYQSGFLFEAIETEKLAIASVIPEMNPTLREEYGARLHLFEAALAKSSERPAPPVDSADH